MFIIGLGTANPPHRYTQAECWEVLQDSPRYGDLSPRSRAVMRKVLTGDNGIQSRHLALERLNDAFNLSPDVMHARFKAHAPGLARQAAERAMAEAKVLAADIDAILISTCTGYLCPGLTSYVSELLGLRADVLTLDLVGQGCGAAVPNLRTAEALLASGQCSKVLSVCVEVCSAAFFLDNDVGVLISACLFGDGAGAVVASRSEGGNRRVEWKAAESLLKPGDREALRLEQQSGMLRNILAPQVPAMAARHVGEVFDGVARRLSLLPSQVAGWILHPGGRDVLTAVRERLALSPRDVQWSESVLREYGNMSSPSVFFVLQAALSDGVPGGLWWMSSFGAGFCCHGALLQVE